MVLDRSGMHRLLDYGDLCIFLVASSVLELLGLSRSRT